MHLIGDGLLAGLLANGILRLYFLDKPNLETGGRLLQRCRDT